MIRPVLTLLKELNISKITTIGNDRFILHILLILLLLIVTCLGDYTIIWMALAWHEVKRLLRQNLNNITSVASMSLLTEGIRFSEEMKVKLKIKYFYCHSLARGFVVIVWARVLVTCFGEKIYLLLLARIGCCNVCVCLRWVVSLLSV